MSESKIEVMPSSSLEEIGEKSNKVSLKTTLSYSIGNFGLNLFFQLISVYLLYFYTDVLGITAAAAGIILLITRIIDGITDVAAGYIVDNTKTKWGKFRPYILLGTFPMVVAGIFTFSTPDLSPNGLVIYAFTTYFLFGLMYTIVNIPYSAMLATMTKDYYERSKLSSIKVVFGVAAMLVATSFTLPIVQQFDSEAKGFQSVAIMFAVVAIIALITTFITTKEQKENIKGLNKEENKQRQFPLKQKLQTVLSNRPLYITLIFIVIHMMVISIKNGAAIYFFTYNFGNAGLFAYFSGFGIGIQLLFVLLSPFIVNKIGKRGTVILSEVIIICSLTSLFFFHDSVFTIFVFGMISYAGLGLAQPMLWALIPDTIEYGEWKTGYRGEGLIYSTFSLMQKVGSALGGALAGTILSITGYVANAEQTSTALLGILTSFTLVPVIGGIIIIIFMFFYKLTPEAHKQLIEEINERKKGEQVYDS